MREACSVMGEARLRAEKYHPEEVCQENYFASSFDRRFDAAKHWEIAHRRITPVRYRLADPLEQISANSVP